MKKYIKSDVDLSNKFQDITTETMDLLAKAVKNLKFINEYGTATPYMIDSLENEVKQLTIQVEKIQVEKLK